MRRRISFNIVDYRTGGKTGSSDLLDLRLQAMKQCNVFVCLQDTNVPELSALGMTQDDWAIMCKVAAVKAPWAKHGRDPVQVEITAAALSNQPLFPKERCFFGWPNDYARATIATQQRAQEDGGVSPGVDATSQCASAEEHASRWEHMPKISSVGACVIEFSSPANLFAVLRKKIAGRVRAMYPMLSVTPTRQWLWNIRLMMEAVAAARGRGVVDRWDITESIDGYVKRGNVARAAGHVNSQIDEANNRNLSSPLVVISESGMGKTSSLVNWMQSYRCTHPSHRVIYHTMLPSPQCTSTMSIIMRLSMELSPWIDESGVTDATSVKALFSTALLWANESAAHSGSLVIIVLDAVNHTHDLSWIPTFLPPAIRLIVSATSKSSFDSKADSSSADSKKTMAKEGGGVCTFQCRFCVFWIK
jgi:hypothetical protein